MKVNLENIPVREVALLTNSAIYGLSWWLSRKDRICNAEGAGAMGFNLWVGKIP